MKNIYTPALVLLISLTISQSVLAQSSNALYFDGSNDRVTISHIAAYDFGLGTFTVELIIKANTAQSASYPPLISNRNGTGQNGFLLYFFGGQLATQTHGANLISSGTNLLDGNCHHIAITRSNDAQKTITYYADGLSIYSTGDIQDITTAENWSVGYDLVTNQSFGGLIKEVRLWNVQRTANEISNNQNIQLTGSETGLIGYWRLDNITNQSVDDISISNNDGVLGATPNVESSDPVNQSGCPITSSGPVFAYGPTTFCTGGDVLLAATAPSGSTYQWKKNGVNISNATAYKYTAKATGNYNCSFTTSGITTLSNTIAVNVLTNPSSFTIQASGATSFCAGGSVQLSITPSGNYSYQWFRGNLGIAGATSSSYTTFNPGSYKAVVTNTTNGCIRLSGAKSVTVNCRMMNPNIFSGGIEESESALLVYPNPAQHSFMIEINDATEINETAKLELMNYAGQKVFETEATIVNGNLQYLITANDKIADGFYTLTVTTSQKKYTSKIIVN